MHETPPSGLDRLLAEAADGAAPCPDPNDLAGFVEGRLDEAAEDAVLTHLAACALCREVIDAVGAADTPVASPGAPSRPSWFRWTAAAAALLLAAVGAGVALQSRDGGTEEGTRARLVAAAGRIADRDASLAALLVPLSDEELRRRDADELRGDGEAILPVGRVTTTRPTFSWPAVPGARSYTITLLGEQGTLWSKTVEGTIYTAEAPLTAGASHVWYVESDDPHATSRSAAFDVMAADEAEAWSRAVSEVEQDVSEPLSWLLLAHAALRRDLRQEALAFARRYADASPEDDLGEATLARAQDRLNAR